MQARVPAMAVIFVPVETFTRRGSTSRAFRSVRRSVSKMVRNEERAWKTSQRSVRTTRTSTGQAARRSRRTTSSTNGAAASRSARVSR